MIATVLDLRKNMKRILQAIDRNESVTLTFRGKKKAVIVPFNDSPIKKSAADHPAFGMWADRDELNDVDGFIRNLRKGRF